MRLESLVTFLLAQDPPPAEPGGGLIRLAFPVIAIGFLFYFMLIRPEKQKQSRHREMLSNLKKNDRVVTVGGIRGVISNVQRDQDEVTVNIDESTGTKIRVSLSSIASIAGQGDENDNKKK